MSYNHICLHFKTTFPSLLVFLIPTSAKFPLVPTFYFICFNPLFVWTKTMRPGLSAPFYSRLISTIALNPPSVSGVFSFFSFLVSLITLLHLDDFLPSVLLPHSLSPFIRREEMSRRWFFDCSSTCSRPINLCVSHCTHAETHTLVFQKWPLRHREKEEDEMRNRKKEWRFAASPVLLAQRDLERRIYCHRKA